MFETVAGFFKIGSEQKLFGIFLPGAVEDTTFIFFQVVESWRVIPTTLCMMFLWST